MSDDLARVRALIHEADYEFTRSRRRFFGVEIKPPARVFAVWKFSREVHEALERPRP